MFALLLALLSTTPSSLAATLTVPNLQAGDLVITDGDLRQRLL